MALRTPTLPDNDEQQDKLYNPGERLSDEKLNSGFTTADWDQIDAHRNDPDNIADAQKDIDKKERDGTIPPDTNFRSTYGGKKSTGGKVLTGANVRAILKKRGPLGLIAVIGLGGGLVGTLLFSPGILLVQMKEALVDRMDTQFASMDLRTSRLVNAKVAGTTSGICGARVTVACKFSTISEKQVARFAKAGIIVDGTEKFGNRIKPTIYTFEGKSYTAATFDAARKSDPRLSAALKKAYNPRYAGFSDRIWKGVSNSIGVTKQRTLVDGDTETKTKALNEDVKNGKKFDISNDGVTCSSADSCTSKDGTPLTDDERRVRQAAIDAASEAADSADNVAADAIAKVGTSAVGSVANFVKVTGAADVVCQAYTAVRAVGYAAKTVRAIQLARYVWVFVNTADQIKAGTAKPEDVAYLGGILTSIAYDAVSGAKRKAAMDSAGMQYVLYGDSGGFRAEGSSYVSQFMAGGGLTGDLIVITDYINDAVRTGVVGADLKSSCAVLANGWVQLGSVVGGIGLLLIPGVNLAVGTLDVVKGGISIAGSVALAVLPDLLKDIVAGNVVQGIVGEDSGNAIASGFGVLSSQVAQAGGNAPLTVDQAVAYTNLQQETIARYGKEEAETLSPFDPTSKYTFVGSMVNQLLPTISGSTDIGGSLSSLGSVLTSSLTGLIPKTSALSDEQLKAAYTTCTDPDYSSLGIATDPFCNPIYGIPEEYLSKSPVTVVQELVASGEIDEYTGEPIGAAFNNFINQCIERTEPLGSQGPGDGYDGSECKITSANVNYYLYTIDRRIDDGMDGYDTGIDSVPGDSSKQLLAQQIIASPNITYFNEDNGVGVDGKKLDIKTQIETIANGTSTGNSAPCQVNIFILKILAEASIDHKLVVGDINRNCVKSTLNNTSSPHWTGDALDIELFDGQTTSSERIKILMDIAAKHLPAGSSFGIVASCKAPGIDYEYKGFTVFDDPGTCGHLHIGLRPGSDNGYE